MKYLITLSGMLLATVSSLFAQAASATAAEASIWDDPMLAFYLVVGFIFILAILVLLVAVYMLRVLNYMNQQAAKEKAARLGVPYVP
ncbi:MAG: hypothetical protein ACKOE6_08675 [Flammeovirgaceae bacterium]